jgi:uncharacterized 2Fe-2S/4Fe-4S cluster protein (DUF4445 family)
MTDLEKISICFRPPGKTIRVAKGTELIDAAAASGVALDLPCGGGGLCGKCRVRLSGETEDPSRAGQIGPTEAQPNTAERNALSAKELAQGLRLACQTSVTRSIIVEVPDSSLLASHHKILARTSSTAEVVADPVVRKKYVELPRPVRGDDAADLERIRRELGPVDVDLELLRRLPDRLREGDFRGTAVLAEGRLVDFEPGNTQADCFAVAVDVGTTTLVAMLLDTASGQELAVASRLNPQTAMGDDVLSRIQYATDQPGGLDELHGAITRAVDEMIGEVALTAGIAKQQIHEVSLSGNTTMQHLLLGVNPRFLGEVPFVPAMANRVLAKAADLGIRIHPHGRAYVAPVIGGFVGGDTVSGILATGLAESRGPSLLIDIGTNGEIVLSAGGKLWAAAAAAGPAFEGARISSGMRGKTGAIERVAIDGDVRISVIGGGRPLGLCGSGLIDLAAELLRHRVISPEGRLLVAGQLPDATPEAVRRRAIVRNDHPAFVLASEESTGTGEPIVLSQRDVRQLQLASGAIRAGIVLLLRRAGIEPSELESVLIAGGFGNFIRRSNAQRIGLIPEGIAPQRIRYQGNTSLAGARMTALSEHARRQAEELARRTEHIDLSTDHGFQWAFADAMIFPEAD